jgi:cyanoexosortase A
LPSNRSLDRLALWALLALEALYVALVVHAGDRAHLGVSLVFLAAVSWLFYEDQEGDAGAMEPAGGLSAAVGLGLILACAAACLYLFSQPLDTTEQHPLRLLPMLMLTGVLLWRGGPAALRRHWIKILVLFFLAGPHLLAWWLRVPDLLAAWSTSFAGYALWYLGVDVSVKVPYIAVSGTVVEITPECAGVDTITYLMGFALLALLLFPVPHRGWWKVLVLAAAVGFFTNVTRIAILAVLSALDDPAHFDYWHTSEGSQVFGVAALAAFSLVYWLLQRRWSARADAQR